MEREIMSNRIRNCSTSYALCQKDVNAETIFGGTRKKLQDAHRLGTVVEGSIPIWYMHDDIDLLPRTHYRPTWGYPRTDHMNTIRRKPTVVKDNTGALKLWLLQHKKNPYPNKPEKIMLAILSRMTMTQVSTWFANARRRLKKEFPDDDFDILADSLQQNNCYTEN